MPIYLGRDKISGGGGVSIEEITPEVIGALPETTTPADIGAIPASEKGAANGVATLDANGKVTAGQVTSLVKFARDENYEISIDDNGKTILLSSSVLSVTLPANVDWPDNFECELIQAGPNAVTVYAGDNVNIYSLDNAVTFAGRFAVVSVKRIYTDTDTFVLAGALV